MSPSHVERLHEQGYAIIRGFLSAEEVASIRRAVDAVYAEGLHHHATYRDGNLCFDILNDPKAMKRIVTQPYFTTGLAINRIAAENGALRVFPGSH